MKAVFLRSTLAAAFFLSAAAADEWTLRLACDLSEEGDHAGASVEFRRLALASDAPGARAAFSWSAAYERWRAGDPAAAERLLDAAEDEQALPLWMIALLRGELAMARRRPEEAVFHFESALRAADADSRPYLARREVAARLRAGDAAGARRAAERAGPDAAASVEAYLAGRDKSPRLGGWLGVIPGLGYAYAGEYANALRSAILNSLFIWGMVETAERDQWAAFAALAFFEVTWFTGSVYGGIDAAHRHNRRRLDCAEKSVMAGFAMRADHSALPALQIRFSF
jgi:tetratricopeptide (TPR) repeat protein